MTIIGTMIGTITDRVRLARRRWRRRRSVRRAQLAFEKRITRARGAGSRISCWSSMPNGSDVYVRELTRAEIEARPDREPARRWLDRRSPRW